jgi:hypothetical protein
MGRLGSVLGRAAIVAGVSLVMFAVAGASALTYPEYTAYYASGGAGIVVIVAGLVAGAVQFDK